MLRLLLIFLLCLIQANCFDVEKYDDMLRRIMENDEVRAKRSPEIETFGSGGNVSNAIKVFEITTYRQLGHLRIALTKNIKHVTALTKMTPL